MDKKKLGWIAALLAGGMMLAMVCLQTYAGNERAAADSRAALAATAAVDTRPAATQPEATTAPLAAPVAAPAAPPVPPVAAVASRDEWLQNRAGLGERNKFVVGSLDPAKGYLFQVEFVRQGAAINTVKLANIFTTDDDKRAWESVKPDHSKYLAKVDASGGKLRGHYSLLNPVGEFLPYATRHIVVAVKGSKATPATIPLWKLAWKHQVTRAITKPVEGAEDVEGVEVSFVAMLYRDLNHENPSAQADYQPGLKITKTYTVTKQDYSLGMRLKVENLSKTPLLAYIDQLGSAGVPLEELYRGTDDRYAMYGKKKAEGDDVEVLFKMHTELQGEKSKVTVGKPVGLGRSDDADPVLWVGHSNKFFASMVYLESAVPDRLAAPTWEAAFYFLSEPESSTSNVHVPAIRLGGKPLKGEAFRHIPNLSLPAGGKAKEMTFDIFAGPKKRDMLSDASAKYSKPLYQKLNYLGSINFQSCFCAINSLTLGMMWLLQSISGLAFGNYGIAIMMLVLMVRLVLHPLTKKSQISMMNMQKLGPEMEKLKKKYADDKEALQRETMKFYKTQGAGPILGCLPMLLQMPIWLSLWGSLNAVVELRHAAFLPIWITDLAAPDAIISWANPITVPLVGGMIGPIHSFNLLPLLLTVAMFLQAKLNPQMSQPATTKTKEQETQQKMMRYMMPAMMLLFFYNAASGLTLYIMTSTFAGVIEQIIIRRHIEAKQAAEAATTTTVKVPGKAPRDSRAKKPKGPTYFKKG